MYEVRVIERKKSLIETMTEKERQSLISKAIAEASLTSNNIMAISRTHEILNSFKSDSTGLPNTADVRAKELADSPSARFRWFEAGFKLTTLEGRYLNRFYGIYENSFSKQRNIYDETARISLNGKMRTR